MIPKLIKDEGIQELYFLFFGIVFVFLIIDLISVIGGAYLKKRGDRKAREQLNLGQASYVPLVDGQEDITEIALLNEEDQVIKTWELLGRTALVIGRDKGSRGVDIDLEESAYSALIEQQHAVLNYAAQAWFIEDLHSNNGVRIQKRRDGQCYKLAKDRPCKLIKGDIVLIANTKLLVR